MNPAGAVYRPEVIELMKSVLEDATAMLPEAKRTSGRHAAPPVGVGSRVASRLAPAARD